MNPYVSWTILLLVAGGLGWYYNGKPQSKTRPVPARSVAEKSEQVAAAKKPKRQPKKAKENKQEKEKQNEKQELRVNTAADEPEKEKQNEKQELRVNTAADEPENDMDNLQFAKEFAKVQTGSALSGPGKESKKAQKKAKTQRIKHGDSKGLAVSTSASSTTGADADDDMSPVEAVTAGDVSDMLEEAAPSASVLRITGAEEQKKQKKAKKEAKPAETKKQRQARLKREKQRAMVQEAEKERRELQEKQLHTAREHERREAEKSKQSAPAPDAWKKSLSETTNGVKPTTAAPGLLDTFDETPSKPAEKTWAQELPSEEEQMRMLDTINSENEWTTVPSKKEKKVKQANKSGDNMSEASEAPSVSSAPSAPSKPKPKKKASNGPTPAFQSSTVPIVPPSIAAAQKAHPLDSDWAA